MTDDTSFLPAVVAAACLVAYALPALTAFRRGHPSRWTILLVNLLLGFTLLGWVISLCWALSDLPERRSFARRADAGDKPAIVPEDENLAQLRTLLDDGVITEGEYEIMRQTPAMAPG